MKTKINKKTKEWEIINMQNLLGFWTEMSFLGKIEFVFFVGAMFFYIRHMILNSEFTPHPVTFGIWLIADVINYITYVSFSEYWIGPLIMPVGAAIVVLWGTVKLIIAKYRKTETQKIEFGFIDWFAIGVSIVSLVVYFITGDGKLSNIMIQVIVFIGFVPLIANLIQTKRVDEPALSWILFCIGWFVTCVDILMGYASIIELIYPFINGLLGCLVVLVVIVINKNKKIKTVGKQKSIYGLLLCSGAHVPKSTSLMI